MPILDIQKRARELGRIRIGQVVPTSNGKTRPEKLDRFRLTCSSRPLLEKVAELYGGTVAEWEPQGGGPKAWEVITDSTRLPIMVPPQPVSQWYEYWTRAGCAHRCDGQTNWQTGEPCDLESDEHLEALRRPTTRLNVVLRDVEGVGVWRLETHGWNAAVELPDAAEFLAQAGGYVNGWVSLEERVSKGENPRTGKPETRRFMVPIIEIDVTPAQLMAGKGRIAAPALAGGPVTETPALAAAGPDYVALAADMTDPEDVRDLWRTANAAGHMTQGLSEHLQKRVADLTDTPAEVAGPVPDADGVVDAEIVPDPSDDGDAVWQQILKVGGQQGLGLSEITEHFSSRMDGMIPDDASAADLRKYLGILEQGVAA